MCYNIKKSAAISLQSPAPRRREAFRMILGIGIDLCAIERIEKASDNAATKP